jgi:hypothetical protein
MPQIIEQAFSSTRVGFSGRRALCHYSSRAFSHDLPMRTDFHGARIFLLPA